MERKSFTITPIGIIHTDFSEKFGIPRQSGLVPQLTGRIVFEPEYRREEAFRELEGFSHIWVIWQFSENAGEWHYTVRPPRLGGNRRVGVFASRSPFRPNGLGLSCVKLESIDYGSPDSPALVVSGADMLDGTPVIDIKPYIPSADRIDGASEGYTAMTSKHRLCVSYENGLDKTLPPDKLARLNGVLANDPRPGYDDSPEKEYGLSFASSDIGFRVDGGSLTVFRIRNIDKNG